MQLHDILNKFRSLVTNGVLAIEIAEGAVRALVVKTESKKTVVSQVAAIERSGGDIDADIVRLLDQGIAFKGAGVVVTDQVKFLASEMSVDGIENLPQDKIDAAARWEIEPYLDFQPSDGLYSCRLQPHLKSGDGMPALMFAMDKGVYGRLASTLKPAGIKLYRAFSPEAALALAAGLPAQGRHKVVVDCRENAIRGVLVSAQGPSAFQDVPLADGIPPRDEETVRNMILELSAQVDTVEEIVLCGDSLPQELVEGLTLAFENLRLWRGQEMAGLAGEEDATEFGPAFALAMGAALQELKIAGILPLGVTDRVPMGVVVARRFRENNKLAPALAAGFLLVCLAGHFAMTRVAIASYTAKIKSLDNQKKKLLQPKQEMERLSKTLAEAERKQAYLQSVMAAGNQNVLRLLQAIADTMPREVVLNRVYQKGEASFWIEGNAFSGQSISLFHQALSDVKGCTSTKLETINRMEKALNSRKQMMPYDFIINVRF